MNDIKFLFFVLTKQYFQTPNSNNEYNTIQFHKQKRYKTHTYRVEHFKLYYNYKRRKKKLYIQNMNNIKNKIKEINKNNKMCQKFLNISPDEYMKTAVLYNVSIIVLCRHHHIYSQILIILYYVSATYNNIHKTKSKIQKQKINH